MLPLKTIARRIRIKIHDMDAITYTDEEILDAINCGIRFIRRAIADIRPALLLSTETGILTAGQSRINLSVRPTKIINATVGSDVLREDVTYNSAKVWHNWNKIYRNRTKIYSKVVTPVYKEHAIHETELAHVIGRPSTETGEPKEFYLTGTQTIHFHPVPEKETKYTMMLVNDIDELAMEDKSPLNTEFDDFLVEYGVIRLSVSNEYDVSQETQVMANIYDQVQRILVPPPAGVMTRSYWDPRPSGRRSGY